VIGIDWGTTSLRAYRLAPGGLIHDRRDAPSGILTVPPDGFPAALHDIAGDWLNDGETRILLAGMVGSRQGWREAPYLPCPAGPAEIAAALTLLDFPRARVLLVPGISAYDSAGIPEVMRGEEVQLIGALRDDALACLPGSHSKWADWTGGRIAGFTTHMTGEAFAALRHHTILGRLMRDAPPDDPAFDAGLARADQPGGLLHHLFGVRALGLAGQLPDAAAASYLSGLLLGHELRAALPAPRTVHLIGAGPLCNRYARAIGQRGGVVIRHDPDAAAAGLWTIGEHAAWT